MNPDHDNWKRLVCLHYSLTTIFEQNTNPNFDVNVFIQGPEVVKTQLRNKFPRIIVNDLTYDFEYNDFSYTLSKWYAIAELTNYQRVLFLDCDTLFRRNCNYIFDKYNSLDFYGIYDNYSDENGNNLFRNYDKPVIINGEPLDYNRHVLGFRGINSGQMMFSNRAVNLLNKNSSQLLINLAKFQNTVQNYINQKLFQDDSIYLSKWINEQFAGQKIIMDCGLTMGEFDSTDISMSPRKDQWHDATITHYISFCNFDIIPKNFIEYAEKEIISKYE